MMPIPFLPALMEPLLFPSSRCVSEVGCSHPPIFSSGWIFQLHFADQHIHFTAISIKIDIVQLSFGINLGNLFCMQNDIIRIFSAIFESPCFLRNCVSDISISPSST